ncbi:HesA/MoeB/ThiF family protein, partial [Candidatus Korarchaeum cryptofilum]
MGEILLTEDEIDRYARQLVLRDIGLRGQERLKSSRVAILGMGGLGTPAALLLTRMGIGFIRIVDRDIVSGTDLHRQVLFNLDDVGLPKVEAAKTSLNKMNPDVEIDAIATPILNENIDKLIEDVDLIIDGLDNIRTRYIINRAALRMGKPYIFSAAVEMFGIVSTIIPGETPCLECFYSGLQDEFLPRCAVVG